MKMVELNGIKIKFREDGDDWSMVNEVFNEDVYKVGAIPFGSVVVDLGAHIGTFTLRCAVERGCKVYSYEPLTETFTVLMENVRLNGLEGKVETFKQAVGKTCQIREFRFYPKAYQSSRFREHLPSSERLEEWKEEMVEAVTLKNVFEDNDIEECEALKMDIEGAEKEILVNKWSEFLKKAKRILVEWHHYDGHVYADNLRQLGFSVLLTGTGVPRPPYDPTFERGMLYAERC